MDTNTNSQQSEFDQETLELLVDGELDCDQRRSLLARLDQMHDGWKQCAIAFLEDAMFRESLRESMSEKKNQEQNQQSDVAQNNDVPMLHRLPNNTYKNVDHTKTSIRTSVRRAVLLPMAGGFLLALIISGTVFLAINQTTNSDDHFSNFPMANVAPPDHLEMQPMFSNGTAAPKGSFQYVTLGSSTPEFQGVQVPCYSDQSIDLQQYLSTASSETRVEVQRLRNAGHTVEVKRQSIIVPVENGRNAVIPIDQIYVKYRTQPKFQ